MSDTLVLTIAVGDEYSQMAKITHPTIKAYAARIGADFLCVDESNSTSPHWEKCQIYHLLNKYKRILYLDTDVIVRDDCPNLFDVVPEGKLGMFNEAPFVGGRVQSIYDACNDYDTTAPEWNGKYYNSGVMVISRAQRQLFKKPAVESCNFYEQGYLNLQIIKQKVEMLDLSYRFNRMTCMDPITGEERHAAYIIHYAGFPDLQFVLDIIPRDIEKWGNDSPEYKYQRHIVVDVSGGLGDQVEAEPAIRYMKQHIYPEDDITVLTHFPRLFRHIEGINVFEHGEFIGEPDTPYYYCRSLPDVKAVMWSIVSNLLCHTVDFCSMALLRRTLPLKDKQVKLKVGVDDFTEVADTVGIRNLNELILIHPGRHWESKTFPVEWWQEIIDGLVAAGLPVCIIGKEEDTRGTMPVAVPDGVIDTRDLLTLGGLMALISQAKVTISNDSCPIHIAGAFDNHIILIPSCKHPDHLLPFRNGSQDYKTAALYKKLTIDDCNTQPTAGLENIQSGEFVKGDIIDYLPDPADVVKQAKQFYGAVK